MPGLWLPWWLSWWRICLQCRRPGFSPWVGKIPWRREWQPTPVFWPGESHGQRSLAGDSPWGHKEWDMIERLTPSWVPEIIWGTHTLRNMAPGIWVAGSGSRLPIFSLQATEEVNSPSPCVTHPWSHAWHTEGAQEWVYTVGAQECL